MSPESVFCGDAAALLRLLPYVRGYAPGTLVPGLRLRAVPEVFHEQWWPNDGAIRSHRRLKHTGGWREGVLLLRALRMLAISDALSFMLRLLFFFTGRCAHHAIHELCVGLGRAIASQTVVLTLNCTPRTGISHIALVLPIVDAKTLESTYTPYKLSFSYNADTNPPGTTGFRTFFLCLAPATAEPMCICEASVCGPPCRHRAVTVSSPRHHTDCCERAGPPDQPQGIVASPVYLNATVPTFNMSFVCPNYHFDPVQNFTVVVYRSNSLCIVANTSDMYSVVIPWVAVVSACRCVSSSLLSRSPLLSLSSLQLLAHCHCCYCHRRRCQCHRRCCCRHRAVARCRLSVPHVGVTMVRMLCRSPSCQCISRCRRPSSTSTTASARSLPARTSGAWEISPMESSWGHVRPRCCARRMLCRWLPVSGFEGGRGEGE